MGINGVTERLRGAKIAFCGVNDYARGMSVHYCEPQVPPAIYEKYKALLREPLLAVEGVISTREETLNVVVKSAFIPPKRY